MKPTTYDELYEAVKSKEIVSAVDKTGNKHRFFIATNGWLCRFFPHSSRRGYKILPQDFDNYVSFIAKPEQKTEALKLKQQYNNIAKYKRMASEATFKNSWIDQCKNLPSYEQWVNDKVVPSYGEQTPRQKGLFELGITTGNKIDGKVVSIDRIGKQYRRYAEQLREAIKNQSEGHICSNVPFAGYEMTISTAKTEVGEFMGYLSLEFKGCGNGYYYLLINDDNFIGYDVD